MENIHLDRRTHRQTDAQTGLILRVKIFSPEMTEYKNSFYPSNDSYNHEPTTFITNKKIWSPRNSLCPCFDCKYTKHTLAFNCSRLVKIDDRDQETSKSD